MKVTLVGFKSLNFTDTEGNKVEGIRLYISDLNFPHKKASESAQSCY